MHIYLTFICFVLGLVIASFLNALLYRIDNSYKYPHIFTRGSHCEKCNKQLEWYELVPVLSYIFFLGKCSQCGYLVPKYYPVSELMLGISFASIYYFSLPVTFLPLIIFLFSMSYFDRVHKGVPKDLVHMFLAYGFVTLVVRTLMEGTITDNAIFISLLLCTVIYALGRIMKKPFGLGDILVILGLGFLLNVTLFLSFVYIFFFISLLYSMFLIAKKKENIKLAIPLLPIMYISFSLMLLFNQQISTILTNLLYI